MGKLKIKPSGIGKFPQNTLTKVKPTIKKVKSESCKLSDSKNLMLIGKALNGDNRNSDEMAKLVRVKRKKKNNSQPSSPEVQLGLKIDALLAERSSPSGTPTKKKRKKKNKGRKNSSESSPDSLFSVRSDVLIGSKSNTSEESSPNIGNNNKTKRIVPITDKKLKGQVMKTTSTSESSTPDKNIKRKIVEDEGKGKKIKSKKQKSINKTKMEPLDSLEDDATTSKSSQETIILDPIKLIEPLKAVFSLAESSSQKNLLDSSDVPIYLQLSLHNAIVPVKKLVRFPLAHHLMTDTSDICLIVRDSFKDPEQTVKHYKKKLESSGITGISEIIPLKVLDRDYSQFEDKRKLCDRFDLFLIDSAISFRHPNKLGTTFYSKKKLPAPFRIKNTKTLKQEYQKSLKKTAVVLKNSSRTVAIMVGHSGMDVDHVRDNVLSIWNSLRQHIPGGVLNIRQAVVKLASSISIPFYISLKPPVDIMSTKGMIWKRSLTSKNPICGEISTQPNATVLVYPNGNVIVEGGIIDDVEDKLSKKKNKENKHKLKKDEEGKSLKNIKEESSDDDIDIDIVEEKYLKEFIKSKALKQLAKEEAVKGKKTGKNKKKPSDDKGHQKNEEEKTLEENEEDSANEEDEEEDSAEEENESSEEENASAEEEENASAEEEENESSDEEENESAEEESEDKSMDDLMEEASEDDSLELNFDLADVGSTEDGESESNSEDEDNIIPQLVSKSTVTNKGKQRGVKKSEFKGGKNVISGKVVEKQKGGKKKSQRV